MLSSLKKTFRKISMLNRLIWWKKRREAPPEPLSRRRKALSPENQAKLDSLCAELFKKKDMITSGKLQFIGLAEVQRRLGKNWRSLKKLVFDTADEVLDEMLDSSDVFIRYHEDTYIIIFAHVTLEEGRLKASMIASEIQRRLFELNEKDLKDLEIRKALAQIKANFVQNNNYTDFLENFANSEFAYQEEEIPLWDTDSCDDFEPPITSVAAEDCRQSVTGAVQSKGLEDLGFSYLPFWDVARNALTTYLCIAGKASQPDVRTLGGYKTFYTQLAPDQRIGLDILTLEHVLEQLSAMEADGRKLLIACPVHYDSLYSYENYEFYKSHLEKIPESQKQFLIFLIMNFTEGRAPKNAYWFAAPLRGYCRHVFAEVPLRWDINFSYFNNSGIDTVGVRFENTMPEKEIIKVVNGLGAKAKAVKISKTFILGVTSLSLTTSAICAGFDYISGPAIHDPVDKPDVVHKYQYQDLLAGLMPKEKVIS